MILIGRLLSPFVRRTLVSLNVLGFECQRKALSTATDVQAIGELNPLRRVPALVLDDGEVLIDSIAILEYLDELVGPERALLPAAGPERRKALRLLSLAVGAAEKGVLGSVVRRCHRAGIGGIKRARSSGPRRRRLAGRA